MKNAFLVMSVVFLGLSFQAKATDVELGWMDIDPCSRLSWQGLETAEQQAYATLHYDTNVDAASVENYIGSCAVQAGAVAGVSALLSEGAGAAPAFWADFEECLGDEYANIFNLSINFDSRCMW